MWYNTKGQERPVKGYTCGFLPVIFFPNLKFLKFLVEKKVLPFSKVALRKIRLENADKIKFLKIIPEISLHRSFSLCMPYCKDLTQIF